MKNWHYLDPQNQEQQAPESELAALIADDQITQTSLVWSEGLPEWTAAGEVIGHLFQAGSSASASCSPLDQPYLD
jgi:hypothetical protein